MKRILNKFFAWIERIGVHNFILIILLLLLIVISGIYQTFSLYTESNGLSIIDGINTYKFILGNNNENRVTIAAGASKNLAITVSNHDQVKLKYGIYYSSFDDLTNVVLGAKSDTEYLPNGMIEANQDYIVTVKVTNHSTSNVTIAFGIVYGLETGGDLVLESGQHWLEISLDPASQYIQDLYNDGSSLATVDIGSGTSKATVIQNDTQKIMLDNNGEYRYYGANPNNYVTFNGELWRIISVSNVKSSTTDTTGEMRMKIIRNEKIGDYSWDSSTSSINSGRGVNDWSQADLKEELNTLYYNRQSGTCYNGENNASTTCDFTTIGLSEDARNMVNDALWYLGGSMTFVWKYANEFYTYERGTTTYSCSIDDGACPRPTSWVGKIGVIYPSDYAYATDLSLCTQSAYGWSDSGYSECKTNDWLYYPKEMQRTLSPAGGSDSNDGSYLFGVNNDGGISHFVSAAVASAVRPTLFLKAGVSIVSGQGTEASPYQLAIGG